MSYRINERPHPRPQRSVTDVATPVRLTVSNGTIAHFAFPCWYQEVHPPVPAHPHDHHRHDYEGWPAPSHPDHCCQLWSPIRHMCSIGERHECSPHCEHYVDLGKVFPIHLSEEGYSSIQVSWATEDGVAPEGLDVVGWIDEDDDWVVRVTVSSEVPTALEKPQRARFSVFVCAGEQEGVKLKSGMPRRDLVVLADLTVLPAGYQDASDQDVDVVPK